MTSLSSIRPAGGKPHDFQVVVVGSGPTGALATNLLGQAGIRTLCVDRHTEVYDKPRAIALDHEVMRVLDNVGLAAAVAPFVAPFDLSEHFGADGSLLRRIGMVGAPYPLGYTPTMVFTQPPVEMAMREHARTWPSVDVRLGTEVTGLTQDDGGVSLALKDQHGVSGRVTAEYVVACDGASSSLRALLGMTLDDLQFDEPWVVIDLLVDPGKLDKLPLNSAHFCEPARPAAYIVGPNNHRRWEIMLHENEDPREMEKPERVWELLRRWVEPNDATLWRAASYRFHALVLSEWSRGRVYFAGDSAHQQPPILGQGMCQGMRDATNLVWRLRSILTGEADASLLEGYGEERNHHVRDLIAQIKVIGAVLCERDSTAAAQRDAKILAGSGGMPATITRQSVIPALRAGLLSPQRRKGTGTLFPQPYVTTSHAAGLLDTVCGTGWRLVLDRRPGLEDATALVTAARESGIRVLALEIDPAHAEPASGLECFRERDGVLAAWFAENGSRAALIRPDHYVFGTAESLSASLDLIAEWNAAMPRPRSASGAEPTKSAAA